MVSIHSSRTPTKTELNSLRDRVEILSQKTTATKINKNQSKTKEEAVLHFWKMYTMALVQYIYFL